MILIPNLVNSVKGIMSQEKTVFDQLAEARTRYAGATTTDQKAVASGEVESALGRLLVIMENYPQLRSIEAVTQLMDELAGTENRISVERGRYNTKVQDYNTSIKKFPTNILASMFNFTKESTLNLSAGLIRHPKLSLIETHYCSFSISLCPGYSGSQSGHSADISQTRWLRQ